MGDNNFKDIVRHNRLSLGLSVNPIAMTGWCTMNGLPIESFNEVPPYRLIIADGLIIGLEGEMKGEKEKC